MRVGKLQMRYEGWGGSRDRAAAISQRALALVAARLRALPGGHAARVGITVHAPRGAHDGALAARIADNVVARVTESRSR